MNKPMGITPKLDKRSTPTRNGRPRPSTPNTEVAKLNKPTTPNKWLKGPPSAWSRRAR